MRVRNRTSPNTKEQPTTDVPFTAQATAQLETHRHKFGTELVELADEKRSGHELRADGRNVPQIARLLRISERTVRAVSARWGQFQLDDFSRLTKPFISAIFSKEART